MNNLFERMKRANPMNARRILMAIIISAIAATMAIARYDEGRFEASAKKKQLTGTWLLTITPNEPGAVPFEGLYTFTSDGIVIFSSVGPPIPGLGNPGHGVWERINSNTFAVTWKQFTFDDIFTTNGSLVINSTITVGDNDRFTSQDEGAIFDLQGNEIVSIGGSVQGRRMKIER